MENNLNQIHQEALKELEAAENGNDIRNISVRYLGRKGILTQFLRNISRLPADQRPAAGKKANEIKNILDKAFKAAAENLDSEGEPEDTGIDVSLPGRTAVYGALHPITQINQQICDIFSNLGFDIAEGPEVESDYYNFEALNFPKDHPARDMQDTFFITDDIVQEPIPPPIKSEPWRSNRRR